MKNRPPRILVADDQRDVLEAVRLLLKGEGYQTESFSHPNALIEALRLHAADAVLMDLNYTRDTTSGDEGLDAIGRIRAFDAHTPIVVMTAWGTIEIAVEAMRRGAQDFIEKPWDNARLLTVLGTQVALCQALRRARALEAENRQLRGSAGEMIAASPVMQPVLETIERVAPADANVLITGESGSGKGLVARMIHERSPRRERSLVVVNIGSLAETVFESELFGHVKGAFTDARTDRVGRFELADGGTLFLDEIANLPVAQQARLLRVLEDGEF
jgi:DNA-binding NtrC family response regulator